MRAVEAQGFDKCISCIQINISKQKARRRNTRRFSESPIPSSKFRQGTFRPGKPEEDSF